MALKGTLKDFGIADIFQLISQQSKTGVLHIANKQEEVRISFSNGDVIRAESTSRKKRDLLGSLLVRSEVLTEKQLDEALEVQKLTLKRLGDILIERGMLTLEEIKEFARLQTTETIYKLFHWESGTYAFESEEVFYDKATMEPIRSENVLMEGFRMVDEWPLIRKKITSYDMNFRKVRELPAVPAAKPGNDQLDNALDDMFSEHSTSRKGEKNIGPAERQVFELIQPDRNVQKYIDLSRLGEFETCKALSNLLLSGLIKVDMPSKSPLGKSSDLGAPGGTPGRFRLGNTIVQAGMYLFISILLYLAFHSINVDILALFSGSGSQGNFYSEPITKELVDRGQKLRIRSALEVYRLDTGSYPDSLTDLLSNKTLSPDELRYPWKKEHFYQRTGDEYHLLRPLE